MEFVPFIFYLIVDIVLWNTSYLFLLLFKQSKAKREPVAKVYFWLCVLFVCASMSYGTDVVFYLSGELFPSLYVAYPFDLILMFSCTRVMRYIYKMERDKTHEDALDA